MLDMVEKWVPHCFEAFMKHRKNGKELSGAALEVVKKMLKGQKVEQENSGLSAREWGELQELLK